MLNFHIDWIAKWAEYTPNKFFLREYESGREWTFAEFNEASNRLANYLIDEIKLKKKDRIAVYSSNNAEYVLLFTACIKTGIILVPLNYRLAIRELEVVINDADPKVIFYEDNFEDSVNKLSSNCRKIKVSKIASFWNNAEICDNYIDRTITEDDYVMILYTSGTTGVPKGAVITHKMLFWNSVNTNLRLDLTSCDHTQSYAPFFHTGGWNVLFTPFLHCGASHTLLKKFDADLTLDLMEKERTTLFFGVPTMLQLMSESKKFNSVDLSSVRYAIVGGAPMPIPLIEKWHEKGVFIRQGYGLTEAGPNIFSLHHVDAIRKKGSIGTPNFYVDVKLVNENGDICSVNEVGELWISSPVVTPGYWKNGELNKDSLTDGWFRTGDLMKYDSDKYFYVVDRKKNMFISGGENVYPAEVEKFLYTNPKIKEVAVIGVPDEKWGEVGKAYIVLNEGEKEDANEIFNFCLGNLAKYKIPKYYRFLKELPRNEAGKINRKKLLELDNYPQLTKGE